MTPEEEQLKQEAIAKTNAIISDRVGNYQNHPFFVKMAERAKAFIEAHGLPKEIEERMRKD
ncbi:hypothetical protein [Puia dinghuensis]|uniref:Uncharacterized protein n=1 Tax=Puia dinghuensis TaxID=1792502 RepID=A0A8J2XWD3_9BACT|nr:hypothetical protein [Puia dinghuensis]GGB23074.1 hypothetical protein GCM10011511_53760 [Puia dinghuensis]